MKKNWIYVLTALAVLLGFSSGAMAYGGGGGGGGGGNGPAQTADSETDTPPAAFDPATLTPIGPDMTFVGPDDMSSVGPTPITILNEDDIGMDFETIMIQLASDPNVQWVVITTGGILIGYATAGAGLPVYAQAIAAGTYAGVTTYATSDGNAGSTAYSTTKDLAVGFIPVPPPAQTAISIGIDKSIETLSQAPSLNSRSSGPGGYGQTFCK